MIGYSSVSHMGYVMMGLATLNLVGINGAVLQMFAHGVMTALFFAMVGGLYDQAHTREMSVFGGLAGKMPLFTMFFIFAGLSGVGLPGLAGFVAEFNIFVGVFRTYPVLGVLAVAAAAVSAAYVFRMFSLVFFGAFNPRWSALKDLQKTEIFAGAVLAGAILFMGVYPKPFTDRISPSVSALPNVTDPTRTERQGRPNPLTPFPQGKGEPIRREPGSDQSRPDGTTPIIGARFIPPDTAVAADVVNSGAAPAAVMPVATAVPAVAVLPERDGERTSGATNAAPLPLREGAGG